MITSYANGSVKNVIRLREKSKERESSKAFITEGVKLLCEAPLSMVREVFYCSEILRKEDSDKVSARIEELKAAGSVKVIEDVKREVFLKMSDTKTPQGVLCVMKRPDYDKEEILTKDNGLYLISENVQDPGNMGTMIRTAESAGVTALIYTKGSADPFQPKCIRSTMGSIFRLPIIEFDDVNELLLILKEKNITTYATSPRESADYIKEDYRSSTAFFIGNEAAGLSDTVLDKADKRIYIPMEGGAESLNAAISAGILVFEASRQRRS